ncbi:MAG: fibronectin type III domain-containing protein, partial [Bacteroidales bacterium]|nr:fibronectin type III domain-containing protein [Bacteroidales bacterium]
YSHGAASCGVAPVRTMPATIDFASAAPVGLKAESWNLPAGWEEVSGNTYNYVLREDTSSKIKLLSVQSTYASEDAASRSAVLSPYIDMGESESVNARIELVYWGQSGNEMVTSKPKSGDTLLVEYQDAEGLWREVASVGASDAVGQDGTYTFSTGGFTPSKLFRLRFTVKSTTPTADMESEDRSTPYVGIRRLSFSPSSCKAASNLQVVEGSLSSTGVSLNWKDENDIAPFEYSVLYKEVSEKDWRSYPVTLPRVQLTGLQAGGSYTVMVKTYCTLDDSAQSAKITFKTPSCGAPTSVRTTHLMATSVDLSWRGTGQSYAVIYAPRVGDVKADTLYTEQTSVSLTDLIPNTPYSVYVISYCGAGYTLPSGASATAYFNTPVLCSAPRIEVVEGSVTWQGVHLAIDAPVPDRQILIMPKDSLEYPVEYRLTSTKDTVKLYGLIDYENITYLAMARSICIVDVSAWSERVEFTTLPKPDCDAPTDLWVG